MFIIELLNEIARTFLEMAPYLLLGLTFAGILHILFTRELVSRHLGGNRVSSIFKSALLGVPLPLCSCGVVPTAISLRKSHASDGATVSFLISTPQTGVDSIIATYGMLGPIFAVFRPIAAFIMGIAGGAVTNLFDTSSGKVTAEDNDLASKCNLCIEPLPHKHSFIEKIWGMAKYGYGEFLDDISKQLVVGIIISGMISYFVPDDFFTRFIGNRFLEMLIMIVGGIPLYVCATASIPIAFALMMKGVSPGAAFVFLAVGPATNAATVTLIGNVMGKKIVAVYLGVITFFSIIAGYIFNFIVDYFYGGKIDITHMKGHIHTEVSPSVILGIIFLIMLMLSLFRLFFTDTWNRLMLKSKGGKMAEAQGEICTIGVEGMTCNKCAQHVTEGIQKVKGVADAQVSLKKKSATVSGDFNIDEVKAAIEDAGYKVV